MVGTYLCWQKCDRLVTHQNPQQAVIATYSCFLTNSYRATTNEQLRQSRSQVRLKKEEGWAWD